MNTKKAVNLLSEMQEFVDSIPDDVNRARQQCNDVQEAIDRGVFPARVGIFIVKSADEVIYSPGCRTRLVQQV